MPQAIPEKYKDLFQKRAFASPAKSASSIKSSPNTRPPWARLSFVIPSEDDRPQRGRSSQSRDLGFDLPLITKVKEQPFRADVVSQEWKSGPLGPRKATQRI